MPLGYFQLCPKLMFESEAKREAIDVIFLKNENKTHFTKMFSFALKVRVFGTQGTPFHVVKNKNLKFGIFVWDYCVHNFKKF